MKKVRRNKPRLRMSGPLLGPKKLSHSWEVRAGNGKIMATGSLYGRPSEARRAAHIVGWLFRTFRHELNPYRRSK